MKIIDGRETKKKKYKYRKVQGGTEYTMKGWDLKHLCCAFKLDFLHST